MMVVLIPLLRGVPEGRGVLLYSAGLQTACRPVTTVSQNPTIFILNMESRVKIILDTRVPQGILSIRIFAINLRSLSTQIF